MDARKQSFAKWAALIGVDGAVKNYSDAMRKAGYTEATVRGGYHHDLLEEPEVRALIASEQARYAERHQLHGDVIIQKLLELGTGPDMFDAYGRPVIPPAARVKALEALMKIKMPGLELVAQKVEQDVKVETPTTITFVGVDPDDDEG